MPPFLRPEQTPSPLKTRGTPTFNSDPSSAQVNTKFKTFPVTLSLWVLRGRTVPDWRVVDDPDPACFWSGNIVEQKLWFYRLEYGLNLLPLSDREMLPLNTYLPLILPSSKVLLGEHSRDLTLGSISCGDIAPGALSRNGLDCVIHSSWRGWWEKQWPMVQYCCSQAASSGTPPPHHYASLCKCVLKQK